MPRGVKNWTAKQVVSFLREHNFVYTHSRGSHEYYSGHYGKQPRMVTVPMHGKKAIKPRTMNGIIRQSGISKNKWFE